MARMRVRERQPLRDTQIPTKEPGVQGASTFLAAHVSRRSHDPRVHATFHPPVMRLIVRLAAVASLALAPCALLAQAAPARAPITAQEIVQRYVAARGGREKLQAIRTLVFRGPLRPNGRPGRR